LLAGTPGLVLAHDSRTLELAEYHQIPWRRLERDVVLDAADLYAEADWGPMNAAHPSNWERFAAFLGKHGLRHVYDDGESGADFDAALAAVDFPPAVRTLMGAAPEQLYAMKQALEDCRQSSSAKRRLKLSISRSLDMSKKVLRRGRSRWRQAERAWRKLRTY
jgi:hypothetical protein